MTGASNAQSPPDPSGDLIFRPATSGDAETISQMAREIWTAVYSEMISSAQLEYMLDWMYAPATLRREMDEENISYVFIECGSDPLGYMSYSREGTVAHLHKLYLGPRYHGFRFGSAALGWLADLCRNLGAESIQLRVNKANASAIRAYERNGFRRTRSICDDIGGGFVMDDYIYVRTLS